MPLSYEASLTRALAQPLFYEEPDPQSDLTAHPYYVLQNFKDSAVVALPYDASHSPAPNGIIVPSLGELRIAIEQLHAITETQFDPKHVESIVTHEGEHTSVALVLGAKAVKYGLQVWKPLPSQKEGVLWMASYTPEGLMTTKLSIGAMAARPRELSMDDVCDIVALGHRDVEYLGHKIEQHNRTERKKIPLPLSYTPSTHRIFDLGRRSRS